MEMKTQLKLKAILDYLISTIGALAYTVWRALCMVVNVRAVASLV
jgi:hypothetical protein